MRRTQPDWKWWVSGFAVAGLFVGVLLSIFITPIYEVSIKLLPAESSRGDLGSLGALGSLADLAGVTADLNNSSKVEALEVLRSRNFGSRFMVEAGVLPVLCADHACDPSRLRRLRSTSRELTAADGYKRFHKLLRMNEDRRTGVITLTLTWRDPAQAANWLNTLVSRLNDEMRQRAQQMTARNLEYLNEQIATAEIVDLRATLFRLVQDEIKKAMLAKVNPEYALRVIDQAVAPPVEDYVWPNVFVLIIGGAVVGGVIGFLLAISGIFLPGRRESAPPK